MLRAAFSATARSAVASSSRQFHTSPSARTITEKVAEVADKVCRAFRTLNVSGYQRGAIGEQEGWAGSCFCHREGGAGNGGYKGESWYVHPPLAILLGVSRSYLVRG